MAIRKHLHKVEADPTYTTSKRGASDRLLLFLLSSLEIALAVLPFSEALLCEVTTCPSEHISPFAVSKDSVSPQHPPEAYGNVAPPPLQHPSFSKLYTVTLPQHPSVDKSYGCDPQHPCVPVWYSFPPVFLPQQLKLSGALPQHPHSLKSR